jgi:hypothetical protein
MTRFASTLRMLGLTSVLAAACGVPTFILQQYDGPPRAAESVAVVRFDGKGSVDLVSLDGSIADAHVPEDARLHVEVLPGRHVLGVARRAAPNEPPRRVVFVAEAARYYEVAFMAPPPNEWQPSVHVFEIDRRSGAKLRDVTYTAPRGEPAPPAAPSAAPDRPLPTPVAVACGTTSEPAASTPAGAAGAPND